MGRQAPSRSFAVTSRSDHTKTVALPQRQQLIDAGGFERPHGRAARILLGERAQLLLERDQVLIELADDADRFGDRASPHLRHAQLAQQLVPIGLAQPLERQRNAELAQQPVRAVHRRRSQPDHVHPPTKPLFELPVGERRHVYLRHKIATRKLGEHARVELVGLGRQGPHRLGLPRIGDLNDPAARLQSLAQPRRAAHHLHTREHVGPEARDEHRQAVLVRRRPALVDQCPRRGERAPACTPRRPIDPHELLPVALLPDAGRPRTAPLHDIPCGGCSACGGGRQAASVTSRLAAWTDACGMPFTSCRTASGASEVIGGLGRAGIFPGRRRDRKGPGKPPERYREA